MLSCLTVVTVKITVFWDMTLFGTGVPADTKQHGTTFRKIVFFNMEVNSIEILFGTSNEQNEFKDY
jgi:hypothetical protein